MESKRLAKGSARIIIAILKHQAELILGESTLNAFVQELGDVIQDELLEKFDDWLSGKEEKIAEVAKNAEGCFQERIQAEYPELAKLSRDLPIADLPSVEEAVGKLSSSIDDQELKSTLMKAIERDWKLKDGALRNKIAEEYRWCILGALGDIEDFRDEVIQKVLLEAARRIQEM